MQECLLIEENNPGLKKKTLQVEKKFSLAAFLFWEGWNSLWIHCKILLCSCVMKCVTCVCFLSFFFKVKQNSVRGYTSGVRCNRWVTASWVTACGTCTQVVSGSWEPLAGDRPGRQQTPAPGPETLLPIWETWTEFSAPGWMGIWEVSQEMTNLSPSVFQEWK